MEQTNALAKEIFKTYKTKVGRDADAYVFLKVMAPHAEFPRYAKMLWRHGMLCEIWGLIASKLDKHGRNYLNDWAEGKK